MDNYPRVLVGTDGSADATAAAQIGAQIAAGTGVPLSLITVWDGDGERGHDWAVRVLEDAKAVADKVGATAEIEPVAGKPPEVMLARANTDPEALVVVGSAGLAKATSRLSASTSNKLTHHSAADVLFAKDPAPRTWNFVALATDGSETSHHAVRHGLRLATALDAKARLITVAKNQEAGDALLARVIDDLGLGGPEADLDHEVLIDTQPAGAIIVAGWKYELVVVGNRGMSGPQRLLGSVANKVTHGLKANLLLVNTTRS